MDFHLSTLMWKKGQDCQLKWKARHIGMATPELTQTKGFTSVLTRSSSLLMAKHAAKASKGKNNVPHVQGEVMKADALQPFVTTFNGCCFK